jgi:Type III restriction enzyme, res subunit
MYDQKQGDESQAVRFEARGRDLAIVPPEAVWRKADTPLLRELVGEAHLARARRLLSRDQRGRCLRARPIDFTFLKTALEAQSAYPVRVDFSQKPLLPHQPQVALAARPYQEEALTAWRAEGYRGVVVLPTGSGKTVIGALAIADLGLWSLVVVPTIDLLRQWRGALCSALGYDLQEVGMYGGGDRNAQPITVITYESAELHPELLWRYWSSTSAITFRRLHIARSPRVPSLPTGSG